MEAINPRNPKPTPPIIIVDTQYLFLYHLGCECIKSLILVCYDRAHPLDNHTKQKKDISKL
jgi:hypothetical protein